MPRAPPLESVARGLRGAGGMSQKCVEVVIGRLATDEGLRARFSSNPEATLRQLAESGIDLNSAESEALLEMPMALLDLLAIWVHPRLQKIALKGDRHDP